MTQATITYDIGFDHVTLRADWAQASSSIQAICAANLESDDPWQYGLTPYQVASAGHSTREALSLVLEYWGTDYWLDPSDDRDHDEILAEIVADADEID